MIPFAQFAVGGLAAGMIYALIGLGIVLLYRSSRVLNFAHGDLATLAPFLVFTLVLARGWGFGPAAAVAVLGVAALAAVFYFAVLRPVKEATLLGRVVVTLG